MELKLDKFRPGHKGQMELYLRWLEKHERKAGEDTPLGIILCAGKNSEQIELLELGRTGGRPCGTLPGTVGRVVQAFKSITTHEYVHGVKQYGWGRFKGKLWQRNYYEHIIRNENELNRIREYIVNNPMK